MAAGFSATDAAFEGLKLTRNRPMAVVIWGGVYLLATVAILGVVFGLMGLAVFANPGAFGGAEEPPPAVVGLVVLFAMPVLLGVIVVLFAAIYRAVLHPEASNAAYMRLGGGELKLLLAAVVVTVIWVVALGVLIGVAAAVTNGAPGWVRGLIIAVAVIAGLVGAVWFGVRISLLWPSIIADGRIDVGRAWRLSQGRFWPMFGSYLLSFAISIAIALVGGAISSVFLLMVGGGAAAFGGSGDPGAMAAAGPALIVGFGLYAVVQVVAAVLQMVIQTAPAAAIYRGLNPTTTADVFA